MDIRPISGNYSAPTSAITGNAVSSQEVKTAAPVALAIAVRAPADVPNMDQVAQAVKSINDAIRPVAQGIEFSVDSDSQRTIVKVVDVETKEILRQIPTQEALEIAKSLDKLTGLLVKEKA